MSSDRIQNIKDHVSIFDVLSFFKVDLPRGLNAEQQVRCPFHGHRGDKRPSARVYPSSQKFWCFYCGFDLDVISFVKEYEGINFLRSLDFLEHHFSVPQITVEDIKKDLHETLDQDTKGKNDSLLKLYEFCDQELIKRKKKFDLKTYSRLFLFLDSTINCLLDGSLKEDETFNRLTKLRLKIEAV